MLLDCHPASPTKAPGRAAGPDTASRCHPSWRRQWHPTPVLLPGKSNGWRSLVGCSPQGHEESDRTERLHFHFSLSCIGEGNGNPLQCSCLENPRDGGARCAAVHGVAQSQTQLKRLSSSSSSSSRMKPKLIKVFDSMSDHCSGALSKSCSEYGTRKGNPEHDGFTMKELY